jgi:hypothetical protein
VVFLEAWARPLLIVHAVTGAASVAVTTHLALWTRKALRGQRSPGAVRWFAAVAFGLFVAQFTGGNLLYPTYKVRVRAEYLDAPRIALEDARLRRQAAAELVARTRAGEPAAPPQRPEDAPGAGPRGADDVRQGAAPGSGDAFQGELPRLGRVARLFDIKEHVAALALPLAAAVLALALAWRPERDGAAPGLLLYGCALALAASTWFAALVGAFTTTFRAV